VKIIKFAGMKPVENSNEKYGVPSYSSGTMYSLYKVFTNVPF